MLFTFLVEDSAVQWCVYIVNQSEVLLWVMMMMMFVSMLVLMVLLLISALHFWFTHDNKSVFDQFTNFFSLKLSCLWFWSAWGQWWWWLSLSVSSWLGLLLLFTFVFRLEILFVGLLLIVLVSSVSVSSSDSVIIAFIISSFLWLVLFAICIFCFICLTLFGCWSFHFFRSWSGQHRLFLFLRFFHQWSRSSLRCRCEYNLFNFWRNRCWSINFLFIKFNLFLLFKLLQFSLSFFLASRRKRFRLIAWSIGFWFLEIFICLSKFFKAFLQLIVVSIIS